MVKGLFFLCFLVLFQYESAAKHIIGGVMSYEFISNSGNINRYKLVLKMYRDCKPEANKADFDGLFNQVPALATVFINTNQIFIDQLNFGVPAVKVIGLEITNKCLVLPPDICVEEGVYTAFVDLPVSTSSYHITYQRCCRNNSISNLVRPGDAGATFTVEITPRAQNEMNSSPQFSNFPPTAICANFPLVFDHSGIDKDGDSLVYSLCAPYIGGGNDDNGSNGCFVVAPDPDCPPPFDEVTYRPPYSALNPLGGDPILTINSMTGLLSGTPTVTGQFVVGICVKEYRAGLLLSEIRRDFQFNVTPCTKTVNALVEALGIEGRDIEVRVCGDSILNITNNSSIATNIFDLTWDFDYMGQKQSGKTKDFVLKTPDLGLYTGTLLLNPGLPCSDTAFIRVNVFPDIRADFSQTYDTCLGKVIDFMNLSVSDAGPIQTSTWKANEVVFATTSDAQFNTLEPDFYNMELIVSDQNQCMDSISKTVPFFPIPKDELISPEAMEGCDPFTVHFQRPNNYITNDYDITWQFGDGSTGKGTDPTHQYTEPGIYNISVNVQNVFGCETEAVFPQTITVVESPIAGFTYLPKELSNLKPLLNITDASKDASFWFYSFGNGSQSSDRNPEYTYPDTGMYVITQIVTHENGCKDTIQINVDVAPKYTIFLPNAFIGGNLGDNGVYGSVGIPFGIKSFELSIYDRWGNKVFGTTDFNGRWDGKNKAGQVLPNGVYAVKVKLTEARGGEREIKGTAVLVQ